MINTKTINNQDKVVQQIQTTSDEKPAFIAYNSVQNITSGNFTIIHPTTSLNIGGCYDTTTGYFTPNVAGWYHVGGSGHFTTYDSYGELMILKNGALWGQIGCGRCPADRFTTISGSCIVYLNGTTDSIRLQVTIANAGGMNLGSYHYSDRPDRNFFFGFYVRS